MSVADRSPVPRMSAEKRRDLVLDAATRAFGRTGYAGTSTDAVAKEAGVSQPYVVRIFGTKLDLFVEVFDRSTQHIIEAFSAVLGDSFDPEDDEDWDRLGMAYTDLVLAEPSLLQVMMHGFAAGGDPQIGQLARTRMAEIFDVVRSSGCTDDRARDFVAHGMLLTIMLAMKGPEHAADDPSLAALNLSVFGEERAGLS